MWQRFAALVARAWHPGVLLSLCGYVSIVANVLNSTLAEEGERAARSSELTAWSKGAR